MDLPVNYERLEFLGDSLLNLIISEWLYKINKTDNEGDLTQKRSELINKRFLLSISKNIFSLDDIIISKSIRKNDIQTTDNMLSDIIESIIGAIFIDSGIKNVKKFIKKHISSQLNNSQLFNKNYKGMLIEKCHQLDYKSPMFKIIEIKSNNIIQFHAHLNINEILYVGIGNTKKNAEINAAKKALEKINN